MHVRGRCLSHVDGEKSFLFGDGMRLNENLKEDLKENIWICIVILLFAAVSVFGTNPYNFPGSNHSVSLVFLKKHILVLLKLK